ncbi:hypothetical protein JHK82_052787 [Glycine max]|nr:hypothetical protein JHK86_052640 [Glycine max]KAG4927005.1 hypothetical protein JHK85_053491 [Glycine max]KAG5082631.1 hypothetical protein JHK84_052669 [Glycine max]KAG5085390.1 hypothetical protein JHK82_052787 [Glycine max]
MEDSCSGHSLGRSKGWYWLQPKGAQRHSNKEEAMKWRQHFVHTSHKVKGPVHVIHSRKSCINNIGPRCIKHDRLKCVYDYNQYRLNVVALFLMDQSMPDLLSHICIVHNYPLPSYTFHDTLEHDGMKVFRYVGMLQMPNFGPLVSLSNYACNIFDVKEEIPADLIWKVCEKMGRTIQDFNYYRLLVAEEEFKE